MGIASVLNQIFRPSAAARKLAVGYAVEDRANAKSACGLLVELIGNFSTHGTAHLGNEGHSAYKVLKEFSGRGSINSTDAKQMWDAVACIKNDFKAQLRSVSAIRGHGPSANTDHCKKLKSIVDQIREQQRVLTQPPRAALR